MAPNRCNDSKFGEMAADRIDHRSLLANEQEAGAVECQTALVLKSLDGDEPHVDPGDRFADRLSVGGIVLLALHVRLHIGQRPSAVPYAPEPAVGATGDAMQRRPRSRSGTAPASQRTPKT